MLFLNILTFSNIIYAFLSIVTPRYASSFTKGVKDENCPCI